MHIDALRMTWPFFKWVLTSSDPFLAPHRMYIVNVHVQEGVVLMTYTVLEY